MKKLSTNQWFVIGTIFAFLGFISFFNIDSALADEKNLNGLFMTSGIVSLIITGLCLYKAKQISVNSED